MDSIEITKNNLNNIKYEDIMFLAFAESGAMGDPGGVEILLKNLELYYTNYCYSNDIELNDLLEVFPPFKTLQCGMCMITQLDKNWKWLDMGFGNYLLVRKCLFKEYINCLKPKIQNSSFKEGEIYNKWREIAVELLKKANLYDVEEKKNNR